MLRCVLDGNTSHCHTSLVLLRKPKSTSTMCMDYSANIHSKILIWTPEEVRKINDKMNSMS